MRQKDIISGSFLLILGFFVIFNSACLDVGTLSDPGPGLIPLMPGIILSILAIALILRSCLHKKGSDNDKEAVADGLKCRPVVVITLAVMLAFALLLQYLGFVVTSILMMLFLFKVIGHHSWMRSILGATSSVGVCYMVFKVWLTVQFPNGPWGF